MEHQLQIIPIPAFKDNYIWVIHNDTHAVIVDPGNADPVLEYLKCLNLSLIAILITHHHLDHIGGVEILAENYPEVKIYAPILEYFSFKHIQVREPDVINIGGLKLNIEVIDLPGHTLGHIAYYIKHGSCNWLFCGDTLFGAGCGRLFEGTALQMLLSLQKLAALPIQTKVYCAHEYTINNIKFALSLEPNNLELVQRLKETKITRSLLLPSLPSSIGLELATNPFLRCSSKEIKSSIQLNNGSILDVFTAIRELRNHY